MIAQPFELYHDGIGPERALKYAVQHVAGDRAEIIEGVIQQASPTWGHAGAITRTRRRIEARADELGCLTGSGNADLPRSPNRAVPGLALVPLPFGKKDARAGP